MPVRTLPAVTAVAVLFSSVALIGSVAAPALADSSAVLPVSSSGDIAVDGVHHLVFISDPTSGKVVATDYSGTVRGTIGSLPGVTGLELSADSGTMYAAVPGADAIAAIDTATLTESARYATGDATDPKYLALAGGKIWFGYGTAGNGDIGSLDLTGDEPVVTLGQDGSTGWKAAPILASTPGAPDVLAAGDPTWGSPLLGMYDLANGTATRTAVRETSHTQTLDLALTPDGSRLITANGDDHAWVWQTSDLAEAGSYVTAYQADAVAVAADSTVAAGNYAAYEPDLYVFRPGTTVPVQEYDFPNTSHTTAADTVTVGGLAWEPGGTRLFAVTTNDEGVVSLRLLTDPAKAVTTVTVSAPAKADLAKRLTVTGTASAELPLAAGTPLTVTRTDMESPNGKALPDTTVKADGTFSFTDTPPAGSKVEYTVHYAGDTAHLAAGGTDTVDVSRHATGLSVNKNGNVYSYGTDVKFTARLGTTYKNRVVEIWANPYGSDKPDTLIKKGAVNSDGNLSATVDMKRNTVVTAVFTGDARYAPKTAKSTAYAKVKISTSVSKHYKTGRIGTHTYYYFHKSTDPVHATTMTRHQAREQILQIQVYANGTWHTTVTDEFPLSSKGVSTIHLEAPGKSGVHARIRSSYIKNSEDNVNYTTHGAWKYLYFTS